MSNPCALEVWVGDEGADWGGCTPLSPRETFLSALHALNIADNAVRDSKIDWSIPGEDPLAGEVSAEDVPLQDAGGFYASDNVESALQNLGSLSSGASTPTANYILMGNGTAWQSVPQTNITQLGTITVGTWNADIISTLYGGTGLDASSAGNGQLLIGNSSGLSLANLTAGDNVTITNGGGSIEIAAPGLSQWSDSLSYLVNNNATTITDHVRVYDNGDLELGSGNLYINSTTTSGGVDIGSGTTTQRYGPFYTYYKNNKTQMLYLQSEIGGATTVQEIGFDIHTLGAPSLLTNLTITLMHTSLSALPASFTDMSSGTVVYGPTDYTLPSSTGWFTIDITDFDYNGSDNILIDVVWGHNSTYSTAHLVYATSTSPSYRTVYGFSDYSTPPSYYESSI
ncbi:hypothetical protein JXI42_09000 [bacterium]|nr:hypothetical protein [bacterium]